MKVNVDFAQCVVTIEFEPFLGDDIEEYQKAFEEWYFVRKGHVIMKRPELNYKCFNVDVIIDWLKIASPKCEPRVITPELISGEEDKTLPYMYF